MPRATWLLRQGRPGIEVVLTLAVGGTPLLRKLLADTGAGAVQSPFHLVLDEDDCLLCGGNPLQPVALRGAYAGSFPSYVLPVAIPALGFQRDLRAVAVTAVPAGFDGIACFSFLNQFTFGNFGDSTLFGLEM